MTTEEKRSGEDQEATVDRLAYSPTEAAEALGIAPSYLYELLNAGVIPSSKWGRRRLIRRDALIAALTQREAVAS
jgi:excisionase family DNA binding protein